MNKMLNRIYLLVVLVLFSLPTISSARNVYLNGTDISSTKSQTLKNVNLVIGEDGSIFIEAPHYQVNEESTYTPITRQAKNRLESKQSDSNLATPEPKKIEPELPKNEGIQENKALREKAGIKMEN